MIKHILSDGTELDSIEGFVVPPSGQTEAVYRLVAMMILERRKRECRVLETHKDCSVHPASVLNVPAEKYERKKKIT